MRRLAFSVDLVNVFSLLRMENNRSAVALDTEIVRRTDVSFCVRIMDGVNGVDGA